MSRWKYYPQNYFQAEVNRTPTYLRARTFVRYFPPYRRIILYPASSTTQVQLGNDGHHFRNRNVSSFFLLQREVCLSLPFAVIAGHLRLRKYVALTFLATRLILASLFCILPSHIQCILPHDDILQVSCNPQTNDIQNRRELYLISGYL